MPYPTIGEYKDAIRLAEHSFGSLTHLRPEYDATGDLHFSSGNFAVVFKMRDTRTNRPVAVKCFVREQPLRRQRYEQISACLDTLPYSPYLLRYTYHPAEIWVETALSEQREFEVVTLDWVEGHTLYNYLQSRCDAGDSIALRKVAEAFDRLALWLLEQPFAHGDLKPDNILVTPRGELVLVDYDGMFTPDMAGQEATELGSPAFRHPRRSLSDFGKYIDHVPILVLSLSLHVLAEHPNWLETYYQGDNLILTANDFANSESSIFHTIRTQCRAWTTQKRLIGLLHALIFSKKETEVQIYLKPLYDYSELGLVPFLLVSKDGTKKWGFANRSKEIVFACTYEYDFVGSFSENISRVKIGNKVGILNKYGQEIVAPVYDEIEPFFNGKAIVKKDKKIGMINIDGQELIPPLYDEISSFCEGLSMVKIYENPKVGLDGFISYKADKRLNHLGKYGFVNIFGDIVIPLVFEYAKSFENGISYVEKDGKVGYVNQFGKLIISLIYDEIVSFVKGISPAKINKKWGYINNNGDVIIPFVYDEAFCFSEDIAKVKKGDLWGYIDDEENIIIPFMYEASFSFSNGLAKVKKDGKWGVIDKKNKDIVPFLYEDIPVIIGELVILKSGFFYGVLDIKGQEIISFKYESIKILEEDSEDNSFSVDKEKKILSYHFKVKKNGKWGIINRDGKEPDRYSFWVDSIGNFIDGVAIVKKDYFYGLMDKNGNMVKSPIYEDLDRLPNSLFRGEREDDCFIFNIKGEIEEHFKISKEKRRYWARQLQGRCGYIERFQDEEKVIIPFLYDDCEEFIDGIAQVRRKEYEFYIDYNGNEFVEFE
ncbi:WG repeat-containing protein [Runella sp.]|uniref:WG repeat-containing protein n=1 Tax=Runella sp. TaxID=1960881 RepID=UPI00261499BD|nr:WG repeat-containing protein [Runella sp.]